jgi:hypothetical protein
MEQMRKNKEYENLKDCTFTPNIIRSPPPGASNAPILVRGLGRFLEKQELARKKLQEQKDREEKVFIKSVGALTRNYTVPEPFQLSSARGEGKKVAGGEGGLTVGGGAAAAAGGEDAAGVHVSSQDE